MSREDNRAKAPLTAAFVDLMREQFGAVTVLYVKEGKFKKGTPYPKGIPVSEWRRNAKT